MMVMMMQDVLDLADTQEGEAVGETNRTLMLQKSTQQLEACAYNKEAHC